MSVELTDRLEALASSPVLLVSTDFDGTIAPIVDDPSHAEANREAIVALKALATMPQTHVAIISGRALLDLANRTRDLVNAHLIGSHGSEYEAGLEESLPTQSKSLLNRLSTRLYEIASQHPGIMIESKPAGFALHYRNASQDHAEAAVEAIVQGPAGWPNVHVQHGKQVIELSVIETNKGAALHRIRQNVGATAVLFIGDDATDEEAFATLGGPDVGLKVGEGDSLARFRTGDTIEVSRLLAFLAEKRAAWLAGSKATPIHEHSLLSDQRTVALVDPNARVVWMCLPRIDSAAVFAELLGGPTAGCFAISPLDCDVKPVQRYVGDTFVLETCWPSVKVIDYLDAGGGRAFQRAGRTDLVRVIEGQGRVRVTFAPRLDFGRIETRIAITDQGLIVEGTVDSLVVQCPKLPWKIVTEGQHQSAVAEFSLSSKPLMLEMRYGTANLDASPMAEEVRRERTSRFWSGWAATLQPPALARAEIVRSALVLKALCYGPSGAITAAATTSLPEHFGGIRNWDYRYCWPRDAAMAASSLLRIGMPGPGIKFLDWVLTLLDESEPGTLLFPLYSVSGGHLGVEGDVPELSGYRGSRPVRVGNAAAHQVQLDIFGPIADLVAQLADSGAALSAEHWRMLDTMVAAIERRWQEPDHGIWEVRRPRQHHVHSKVMCWQTVDRAIKVAHYLGRSRPDWVELRARIAEDVLSRGWNEKCQSFCATYEDGEPDASALCVGLSGLLAPHDPKFHSTVEFVEKHLSVGTTVYRYRYDDGLPGIEGGFNLCTTWLIEAYAMIGRRKDTIELFNAYLKLAGPTGLIAEEVDPRTHEALGNYPQAYSHLGLILAALSLSENPG